MTKILSPKTLTLLKENTRIKDCRLHNIQRFPSSFYHLGTVGLSDINSSPTHDLCCVMTKLLNFTTHYRRLLVSWLTVTLTQWIESKPPLNHGWDTGTDRLTHNYCIMQFMAIIPLSAAVSGESGQTKPIEWWCRRKTDLVRDSLVHSTSWIQAWTNMCFTEDRLRKAIFHV